MRIQGQVGRLKNQRRSKRLMATELFWDPAFIAEAGDRVGSDRAGAGCQSRSGRRARFTKR